MATRSGPIARAVRRVDDDLHRVLQEIETERRGAGISFDAIGQACHVAGSTAARTVSGRTSNPDLRLLAAIAASVGHELRLRTYLAGDPLRDAGQRRLLGRLRVRLAPALRWRTEVGLPIDGDRRAWDAVICGDRWRLAVEAETVIGDLQALERRLALKLRDGGIEHVILLVADTRWNRAVLAAPGTLSWLGRDARRILRALGRGEDPGTSALLLL